MLDPANDAVKSINPRELKDDDLAERGRRNVHVTGALQTLLNKNHIAQDDVVKLLHRAVQEHVISEDESGHLFNSLPRDQAMLRHTLQHLFHVTSHVGTLIKSEALHRAGRLN